MNTIFYPNNIKIQKKRKREMKKEYKREWRKRRVRFYMYKISKFLKGLEK